MPYIYDIIHKVQCHISMILLTMSNVISVTKYNVAYISDEHYI